MIPKAVILFSIFLAAAIQFSFFPALFPLGVCPDLLLLLVIFWAIQIGFEKTAARTILAGFFVDLYHFQPVGINILLFSLAAFSASSLAKRFLVSHKAWGFFFNLGVVAIGTVVYTLFFSVAVSFFGSVKGHKQAIDFWFVSGWDMALKVVLSLVVFALIFRPLEKVEKTFEFYGQRIAGFKR